MLVLPLAALLRFQHALAGDPLGVATTTGDADEIHSVSSGESYQFISFHTSPKLANEMGQHNHGRDKRRESD